MTEGIREIVFRSSAAIQAAKAQQWYETQRSGLGAEFALHLEAATHRAARHPEHCPIVYLQVRRIFLKRFPYALFFLPEEQKLVVLSCLHTKRDPAAWPGAADH
ncbi:type II toxin-antitoxin system RelE/ParE family toxin [Rhodoferax sp.]|uniref:type II toxin-antitoxin system RelE/ParE family toxin n=1 Tax=Rhodoferax sp. TaxID=50421 RepID=UPI0027447281|nr:hypothetical protein [Rhodoferax sp.]